MADVLTSLDQLLQDDGAAAIVLAQWLAPVGGDVIYPPTYANPDSREKKPVYNIDRFNFGDAERSVCVIDSIPSQANRIEPAFARIADGKLVPQMFRKVNTPGVVRQHLAEPGDEVRGLIVARVPDEALQYAISVVAMLSFQM